DLLGCHRVRAALARVAAEGAIAAVVAAERRERDEDLRRERDGAAAAAVAQLAGAGDQVVEPGGGRLDEGARVLMRDHARRRALFFGDGFAGVFAPPVDEAAAFRAPLSLARTSLAKRSMFARTARSSCTV